MKEAIAVKGVVNTRNTELREQHGLRQRLGEEEEFRAMAVQRMQPAERRLQHTEETRKHSLPTMHGELVELRRNLLLQEEMNVRVRSELEASRQVPQTASQHASCVPILRELLSRAGNMSQIGTKVLIFQ